MAKNSSFDIVSQIDMQELDNALNQTRKESNSGMISGAPMPPSNWRTET